MIPVHAHQWTGGSCHRCGATRCDDRNAVGFRCVDPQHHDHPHHYADGTRSS